MDLKQFQMELETLTLFHRILEDEIVDLLIQTIDDSTYYRRLCSKIYDQGDNISDYIYQMVMTM